MLLRILFGLILITCPFLVSAQYSWEQKTDFPGGVRINSIAFSIGDRGYVGGGGIITAVTAFDDLWEYNPWTDTWLKRADFPGTPRTQAVSFSMGGKGYVGMGFDPVNNYIKDFWEYDPDTDQWTQLADFPGLPRDYAVAFSIGDYAYVGLGTRFNVGQLDFYRYDPSTDQWSVRDSFPGSARTNPVAFALGDKGYVTLGAETNPPNWPNDLWEYDPSTDSWTRKLATIGGTRNQSLGFSVKHLGLVGFGNSSTGLRKDFWIYDPTQDDWSIVTSNIPADVRNAAIGMTIGNRVFVGLGNNGTTDLKDFWELKGVVPENLEAEEITRTQSDIQFYPNPMTTEIRFVWNREETGTLVWYQSSGEIVAEYSVHQTSQVVVSRNGMAAGIYRVQWHSESGRVEDLGNVLLLD
ncbi:hypothetical protein KFE98_14985 [bacterium SCSIO 12741]|nr:hypothetical protein KFE98_14985 [bacterium SCSIO 12741]